MAHRRGLAGSVRGMPCCPTQVSGRGVCMAGRRAGLPQRDLIPRPDTPEVDRPTWTVVLRPCLLEVVEHALRAVSRPPREQTMIVVLEGPAATYRDEPRISDLGEITTVRVSLLCPPRVARSASDEPAALWSIGTPFLGQAQTQAPATRYNRTRLAPLRGRRIWPTCENAA
jgi:hypothetical protein